MMWMSGNLRRREVLGGAAALTLASAFFPSGLANGKPVALRGDALVYPPDYLTFVTPEFLDALKTAKLDYIWLDISYSPEGRTFEGMKAHSKRWRGEIAGHSNALVPAKDSSDILNAAKAGKTAVVLQTQALDCLEGKIERLEELLSWGFKVTQLTHNNGNSLGSGGLDPEDKGMSPFGEQVVEALNEKDILIDLAHASRKTQLKALEMTQAPVVISHTGLKSLYPSIRNIEDDIVKKVADSGGVIGVFGLTVWLGADKNPNVSLVIRHINRILNLAGEDHAGIGSDSPVEGEHDIPGEAARHKKLAAEGAIPGYYPTPPHHSRVPQLAGPGRYDALAQALNDNGLGPRVIDKILGENFFRVFREVTG